MRLGTIPAAAWQRLRRPVRMHVRRKRRVQCLLAEAFTGADDDAGFDRAKARIQRGIAPTKYQTWRAERERTSFAGRVFEGNRPT